MLKIVFSREVVIRSMKIYGKFDLNRVYEKVKLLVDIAPSSVWLLPWFAVQTANGKISTTN